MCIQNITYSFYTHTKCMYTFYAFTPLLYRVGIKQRAWKQLFCYGAKRFTCGCPCTGSTDLWYKAWTFIALRLFSSSIGGGNEGGSIGQASSGLSCQKYMLSSTQDWLPQVWSSGKHPTSKGLSLGTASCCEHFSGNLWGPQLPISSLYANSSWMRIRKVCKPNCWLRAH